MTGEITLRGKVLPVGGIREKVLAAHRAGIRKVLLPRENEADIQDIPEAVRDEMEFVLIKHVKGCVKAGSCKGIRNMKINSIRTGNGSSQTESVPAGGNAGISAFSRQIQRR